MSRGRRAKPPMDDMLVQGLSTADAPVDIVKPVITFVDDFDPSVMLPVAPHVAQQRIAHAKVMTDYKLRQRAMRIEHERKVKAEAEHRRKHAEDILARKLGLLPIEPTLAHNQLKTESGLVITVGKARSWRRL